MRALPGGRNTIERIARLGYGARGVVYIVVGGLALLAALGHGGRAGDSKDALRTVLAGPFGAAVVGVIALGLLGFALWRSVEGITDADQRGTSAKGLAVRGAHLISAGLYLGLAVSAASLSLGLGMSGGDGMHDWTAWLLGKPFGRWLVALVGLAIAGGGFGFLGKAWRGDVTDRLALDAQARLRGPGRGLPDHRRVPRGGGVAPAVVRREGLDRGLRAAARATLRLGAARARGSRPRRLRHFRADPGPLPAHRGAGHRPGGRRGRRGGPGADLNA
jgi:Domain of Unknown Function (DUF1206)